MVVAILALKFLKLIGKIIGTVVLIVAACIALNSIFGINVVEIVSQWVSG